MTDRTELIHVGFDNSLALNRVIAVAAPSSAPMKRAVQRAKQQERIIDLTSVVKYKVKPKAQLFFDF